MPEFIVDANLPYRILIWQNELFEHVLNINPLWDDKEIWNHAKKNNLVIITKDKDFRLKQIMQGSPPKIIHIKFGNLKLNEFEQIINVCWPAVEVLIKSHTLINIYLNTIEAIK
jgi:predicted nuclease of predicted toxin-antitoxin system